MSSYHMSFRLNHYQIAKALRILVTLEPNQPISSLSQAVKLIIIDWISKHSINSSLETSQADIDAVKLIGSLPANQIDPYNTIQNAMAQANARSQRIINKPPETQRPAWQIQEDIENEKYLQQLKQESRDKQTQQETELAKQIELAHQTSKGQTRSTCKPSEFHDPNITESIISSVTDFSPPAEWKNKQ